MKSSIVTAFLFLSSTGRHWLSEHLTWAASSLAMVRYRAPIDLAPSRRMTTRESRGRSQA